jgi:hypothetical protein
MDIGLGNRGDQVLDAFLTHPDADVAAIFDIHPPYLDFAAKKIGSNPQQFRDYRKMLERKDFDAVVIATPDHWHALQTIHACGVARRAVPHGDAVGDVAQVADAIRRGADGIALDHEV